MPRAAAAAETTDPASDGWPTRPVTLVVPFVPGGPADVVARLLAEPFQARHGQPLVLEYKPGAGTIVGTQFVAHAAPDGYTLGLAVSALQINPGLEPRLPYDTLRDLRGVSQIAYAHFGLFANPALGIDDLPGLIAYARRHKGPLAYATPGIGTGPHLAGVLLARRTGIDLLHVPYRGSAPAQQDVVAGRVPLLVDVLFAAWPLVREGRLKALALASPHRSSAHPELPLIADTLPGFSAMSTIGVIAPAALPRERLRRIGAALAAAVHADGLGRALRGLGMEPVGSTPDEYDALIRGEIARWTELIRRAGITPG
ncbi:MAG: tripartite tricarboxylate transporter substrate binding protein [Burkholderiales bacterium]|nr:tripartite tricarboxylate transporter substrate binding protein [Burkholderiales bacterium]